MYIGEIRTFAFIEPPDGWATCNGQELSIYENQQNQALFSLIGTTFGGNGVTTFRLPNLAGLAVCHPEVQDDKHVGEIFGLETCTLSLDQVPTHTHALMGADCESSGKSPAGCLLAQSAQSYAHDLGQPGQATLSGDAVGRTGSGASHENRQPFLVLNYCISMRGAFPPRPFESL